MDIKVKYWYLSQFQLAKRLNNDEMMQLCGNLVLKHFKKGAEVSSKHFKKDVFFLKRGSLKIVNLMDSGELIIKEVIREGDIFGILGLLKGDREEDFAIALEDTCICAINATTLKNMMTSNESLNNYIFTLAGSRIQKIEKKLMSLIYKDANERIEEFVREYILRFGEEEGDFIVAKNLISHQEIGKLTSTSRQTVNKVLNALRMNEIIDFDKYYIKLNRDKTNSIDYNKGSDGTL
ncbi:Crp/Fnr family transcriptional regulator [Flagellimonas sp. 2504JD4-2]